MQKCEVVSWFGLVVMVMWLAGVGAMQAQAAQGQAAEGARLIEADDGVRAVILVPESARPLETTAARELSEHLALIGHAAPERRRVSVEEAEAVAEELRVAEATPILLGSLAREWARPRIERATEGGDDPDGAFAFGVNAGIVRVAGLSPRGTLNGVYELLEQVGFRWFMPGALGRTLPLADEAPVLMPQETVQVPSFRGRIFRGEDDWGNRNRLGGEAPAANLNMPSVGGVDEQPHRYALVDGERTDAQLCVSNRETIEAMVEVAREYFRENPERRWLALGTHGGSHCECEDCRALDPDEDANGGYGPFTDGLNVTDRYIRFANRVLAGIADEFPERRMSLQFASGHVLPPVNETGAAGLDVIAWTVGYCRIHGAGNPVCAERMMVGERTRAWVERLEGGYYERTAWGNVAGAGFLFPLVHRYRRELPLYHAHGVNGFRIAPYSNWASENPSAYIGARLLWDHEADVDALLEDFYRRYYGQAAEPMRAYHELIEATAATADHHTGTSLDMPHIYTAEVRAQARAHLEDAQSRAEDEVHQRRIEHVVLALDYLEAFVAMLEHRDRHDYAEAVAALERAERINERLRAGREIPLLMDRSANYLERFFGQIIREAHQRTSEEGELVAGLDDEWRFQIDPEGIGESLGLHRPEVGGGNWQSLRAWSSSWSNQGLRYYRGDAWYRQSVEVPERFAGRRLVLWIGAVDERARVWLNGRKLGDTPVGAFRAVEFDATDAVEAGEENLVVIRTGNHVTQEVGTGGLLAPVMLHAPAD